MIRFFTILIFILSVNTANAQTLTALDNFDYGFMSVVDNTAVMDLTIGTDGSVSYNSAYISVFEDGSPARFQVTGLDPNTGYTVDVADAQLDYNGVGPDYFRIVNAIVDPSPIVTNSSGVATFLVGSTLRTSGINTPYAQGNYTGSVLVTVNN